MKNICSMKYLFLVCVTGVLSVNTALSQTDPVLLNIGGKDITRSEFEKIYKKTNS